MDAANDQLSTPTAQIFPIRPVMVRPTVRRNLLAELVEPAGVTEDGEAAPAPTPVPATMVIPGAPVLVRPISIPAAGAAAGTPPPPRFGMAAFRQLRQPSP